MTLRMLKLADLVINKGVEPLQVIEVLAAIIPTFLEMAIPMSAILAVILTYSRLSADSELVVMRASGRSLIQLIQPCLYFGIGIVVITFVISMVLRPWGYKKLEAVLFGITTSQSTSGLSQGVFNKLGDITLYAESIDHRTNDMTRVVVDDRRDTSQRKVIFAKNAEISSNPKDLTLTFMLHNGVIHERGGGSYNLTRFNTHSIVINPLELAATDPSQRNKRARELYYSELKQGRREAKQLIKELQKIVPETAKSKGDLREALKNLIGLQIEIARKFAFPVAGLLLSLLAMPLGIQPPRQQKTWGASLAVFWALVIIITYYLLMSLSSTLAKSGGVSPTLAIWIPNLIFACITAISLWRVSLEKAESLWTTLLSRTRRTPA